MKKTNNHEPILIEIAPGELFDRLTILDIKIRHAQVAKEKRTIEHQRDILRTYERTLRRAYPGVIPHVRTLAQINKKLWNAEDTIRALTKKSDTGARFIATAQLIHTLNDERNRVKRLITTLAHSSLLEVKIYKKQR